MPLKGFNKISISNATDARLKRMKRRMMAEEPEKYDDETSYNTLISWIIDRAEK
jgi:hypothetical protein